MKFASCRSAVKEIVRGSANPEHKLFRIREEIHDLCERAKFARSSGDEIMELKQWLGTKVRGLAGNNRELKKLPNELVYQWHQHLDSNRHQPYPNFSSTQEP